jgi:uncharacterized protein YndB with AHSA1/START domain
MSTELRFVELYPYPRERVWRALTSSEAIADWLMPNDFAPVVGHRFEMRTRPAPGFDGVVRCEVTVVEPPARLAYKWRGGGIDTVVTFTLEPVDQGTKLTLVHSGFSGLRGWMISRLLGNGWRKHILRKHLPSAIGRMSESGYVALANRKGAGCSS